MESLSVSDIEQIMNSPTEDDMKNYVYCFPQIDPLFHPIFHESTFDFYQWSEKLCTASTTTAVPEDVCICKAYDKNVFEYSAKAFWVFPYYIKARIWNAWLSVQWVLTHYLTEGSMFDKTWHGFFDLFFPYITPAWWKELWGKQSIESSEGWVCLFLHTGSLLFTVFWGFTTYLIVTSFFAWCKLVITDIVDVITYIPELLITQSSALPQQPEDGVAVDITDDNTISTETDTKKEK